MAVRKFVICCLLCLAVICCLLCLAFPRFSETATPAKEDNAVAGVVPITIELPQPSFIGTPLDYRSKRLEPPSFRMRKPFLTPKGTLNAALKKTVTTSEIPLIGKVSQIVDGKKQHNKEFQVELPNGPQWIQIDLGAPHHVHAIIVWHYHESERVYFDFAVMTAMDEKLSQEVKTHYNNDHDNSSGLGVGKDREYVEDFQGRLVDAKGARARYVRLNTNGNTTNDLNHYIEVEVWARPTGE